MAPQSGKRSLTLEELCRVMELEGQIYCDHHVVPGLDALVGLRRRVIEQYGEAPECLGLRHHDLLAMLARARGWLLAQIEQLYYNVPFAQQACKREAERKADDIDRGAKDEFNTSVQYCLGQMLPQRWDWFCGCLRHELGSICSQAYRAYGALEQWARDHAPAENRQEARHFRLASLVEAALAILLALLGAAVFRGAQLLRPQLAPQILDFFWTIQAPPLSEQYQPEVERAADLALQREEETAGAEPADAQAVATETYDALGLDTLAYTYASEALAALEQERTALG